jgi:hypothetical protein
VDREIIRVLSRRAPTLSWYCSRCHDISIFHSTELFRANANGKLIDVWLTYRCRRCDHTRNFTVIERTAVKRLRPGLLEAAESNDALTAGRLSRDLALIQRNGARVAEGDQYEISPPTQPLLNRTEPLEVVVEFPEPLLVQLDVLLAEAFSVPRTRLRQLLDSGTITLQEAGNTNKLRMWDGLRIRIGARRSV